MASTLPSFPRFVFTVFEPLSLLLGFVPAVFSPEWFLNEQLPQVSHLESSANSVVVARQLGNIYGLLSMVGIAVLYTTTEAKVVRNYLIALAIADVGHVAISCHALGYKNLLAVTEWNGMTWGNVVVTVLLFGTRLGYFLGAFGPDIKPTTAKKSA